jgi:outer membrane protein assembly factor BamB
MMRRASLVGAVVCLSIGTASIHADDWPEWRGRGRLGVWNETGILEKFPEKGLNVLWRTPVKEGYSGPAVADGRVFVTDFSRIKGPRGIERVLCLDEKTGRVLWMQEWQADYGGIGWENGPHATPTVDGDRVYVLGSAGVLLALNVRTGEILWRKDYVKDYGADLGTWGISGAPLVDGDRLICLVGGEPDAKVVAFDKMTGKEIWRALGSNSPAGVSQPIIISAGGTRQLIIWHPQAVVSLDPATGKLYWEQPFKVSSEMTIPMVHSGLQLLVSSFYDGPLMLSLDDKRPASSVLWKGKSSSEVLTDGLHATIVTPVIQGDYIYGICSYGQLRCLNAKTGERVWETQAVTIEKARWASAQIVRNGDRYFLNNDRGELIIARFTPEGYQEVGRTQLLKPTTDPRNRRQLVSVNWMHPAYANKHIYARNDEEIICASLAADGK